MVEQKREVNLLFDKIFRKDDLETKIIKVQKGNMDLREELLKEYEPFILKNISKVCKRYITNSDEEFSIGLSAFNEAIDNFDKGSNSSFLSFASLIIKRRTIDYIRSESRNQHSSFDFEHEEHSNNPIDEKISIENYSKEVENEKRKLEILEYQQELQKFDLSFEKLVKNSPKHKDTRKECVSIANIICKDDDLKDTLLNTKKLPLKKLEGKVSVSRKTLERNRNYIIAIVIIYTNNFSYLKEYLSLGGE